MSELIMMIIVFMAIFLGVFALSMLAMMTSLIGRLFFRTRNFIREHVLAKS